MKLKGISGKRVIGVDFDDVCVDSMGAVHNFHNEKYGTNFAREQMTSYALEDLWNIPVEMAIARVLDFYATDHHHSVLAVPGAAEVLGQLVEEGNKLCLVSARPVEVRRQTEALIDRHFAGLFHEVHLTGFYHSTKPKTKGEVCRALGVEVFIEDAPKHALSVHAEGIDVLLFDTPWNQVSLPDDIRRVKSWDEIGNLLRGSGASR